LRQRQNGNGRITGARRLMDGGSIPPSSTNAKNRSPISPKPLLFNDAFNVQSSTLLPEIIKNLANFV